MPDRENPDLPDPLTVLRDEAESIPPWLLNYTPGDPFPREVFFASRTVYYPGSRTDGNPLEVFGKSHSAHCFVYCDNSMSERGVRDQLEHETQRGHPKGYRQIVGTHVLKSEITPHHLIFHFQVKPEELDWATRQPLGGSFVYWAVLEREESYDDDHGPKRLSILHVGGEGIATFDALFCQRGNNPPFAILLQDHGYGGNWTKFGGPDSPLLKICTEHCRRFPKWLLVADNTDPWPGYAQVSQPERNRMRSLFRLRKRYLRGMGQRRHALVKPD